MEGGIDSCRVLRVVCALSALAWNPPIAGQEVRADPAWEPYEGYALAAVTSGCFTIRHQSTWTADSLRYPEQFELRSEEFKGLGYHRMGTFITDMAALFEEASPPVWRPISLDTTYIDPDPRRVAGPGYHAYLHRATDSNDFLLETYWQGENPLPGDDPARGRLVGRAYGSKGECIDPQRLSGDT